MKNFNYQLAGDNGVHFYPLKQKDNLIKILLFCFKNDPPNGVIDIIPSLVNLLVVFDNYKTSSNDNLGIYFSCNIANGIQIAVWIIVVMNAKYTSNLGRSCIKYTTKPKMTKCKT